MDTIDKITKKKRFKNPRTYYAEFAFLGVMIPAFLFAAWLSLCWISDEMLYDIAAQELRGAAEQRSAQLTVIVTIKYFGREGLAFLFIFFSIITSLALRREIKEYRRYKHKRRLFDEGVIDEIYDD